MLIRIDSEYYGDSAYEDDVETLEQLQAKIRACGLDFAGTTLELRGSDIYDETGRKIGQVIA